MHSTKLHFCWLYFTSSSSGESVPVSEQHSSKEQKTSEATPIIDTSAPPPEPLSDSEKTQYEELINDLYLQLDDKVINTLSLTWC